MIDKDIKTMEVIFNENFPKEITDKIEFYTQCRFIKLPPYLFIETITDYKNYLQTTGYPCKTPEEFLKSKMYLINYANETNKYSDKKGKRTTYDSNGIPLGWTYFEDIHELTFYFKNELENQFRNSFKYGEFHHEVTYQYKFKPQFRTHDKGFILNENNCLVENPYMHEFRMEEFNKLNQITQYNMIKELVWKRLPWEIQYEFIKRKKDELPKKVVEQYEALPTNVKCNTTLIDYETEYYKEYCKNKIENVN